MGGNRGNARSQNGSTGSRLFKVRTSCIISDVLLRIIT